VSDARFDGYRDISDVHPHKLREIREFFETYKRLEPHKWVKFREWKNVEETKAMVTDAMDKYERMAALYKE